MPSIDVPCLTTCRANLIGSAPSRREPGKCSDAGSTCKNSRGFMEQCYHNAHRPASTTVAQGLTSLKANQSALTTRIAALRPQSERARHAGTTHNDVADLH